MAFQHLQLLTDRPAGCRAFRLRGAEEIASNWRLYHLVLKGHALRIIFLEPSVRRIGIGEDLEVIGVPDLLARIHVNEHSHGWRSDLADRGSGPDRLIGGAEAAHSRGGPGGMSRKLT
jgi:hypothetical protein